MSSSAHGAAFPGYWFRTYEDNLSALDLDWTTGLVFLDHYQLPHLGLVYLEVTLFFTMLPKVLLNIVITSEESHKIVVRPAVTYLLFPPFVSWDFLFPERGDRKSNY